MAGKLIYRPNPAHKSETTGVGPPRWRPGKEKCPSGMLGGETRRLLKDSVSAAEDPLAPTRFAVRRSDGRLEWFVSRLTRRHADGRVEVHGHPFVPGYPKVPPPVLRKLRDSGTITPAEYDDMVKA